MIEDLFWSALLLIGIAVIGIFLGRGTSREDVRARRRWDAAFDFESRKSTRTDATGVLRCRSCGSNLSERAGLCSSCGSAV